jgi:hypothetical protein
MRSCVVIYRQHQYICPQWCERSLFLDIPMQDQLSVQSRILHLLLIHFLQELQFHHGLLSPFMAGILGRYSTH